MESNIKRVICEIAFETEHLTREVVKQQVEQLIDEHVRPAGLPEAIKSFPTIEEEFTSSTYMRLGISGDGCTPGQKCSADMLDDPRTSKAVHLSGPANNRMMAGAIQSQEIKEVPLGFGALLKITCPKEIGGGHNRFGNWVRHAPLHPAPESKAQDRSEELLSAGNTTIPQDLQEAENSLLVEGNV
ncbi:hypothetical protein PENSPDRAFT_672580, partial [Peniophora sp. CONT]